MQASHFKNELTPNAITPGLCYKSKRPFKVKQMVKQKTAPYINTFFCMHLGPTTSELYCSMTRIYNIASFELDASPKDYKPTNFLNHKHSLRFLLSQSYESNKKTLQKRKLLLESCMELWEWITAPLILSPTILFLLKMRESS